MNLQPAHLAELRALLDALCEEASTPEQMARLEELLRAHPEAEAYYVQFMGLHAELVRGFGTLPARIPTLAGAASDAGASPASVAAASSPRRRGRRGLWIGLLGGAAAVAAAAAVLLWVGPVPPAGDGTGPTAVQPPEASDDTVAVLLHAPDARWEDAATPMRPGTPLWPGWLKLKSGFAHIEFYNGATVILQGPADFQIISRDAAYCARGKLRATVPPQAQGFTIGAPTLDLVDRGTEFGMEVSAGDRTEVHVFQGKVDLYDPGARSAPAPRKALRTGEGVRLDGPGHFEPIDVRPAAFTSARDLAKQSQAETARRQGEWLAASRELRRDPSLVVYYPFDDDDPWSRTLSDRAPGRGPAHDGAIVGCTWAAGRWPGRKGLEFKRVSDRVRLHVPGDYDALTLMAWVRVDALPNRFNSLLMTEGWEEAAPHWHISNTGRVELGVQGYQRKGGVHYLTDEVVPPERLGQWVHLAVTYNRGAGMVTHYVDGQPVQQDELKLDIRLRLGDVEIGNWNLGPRPHHSPVRYFNGCIDEFLVFGRALGAAEVERLYEQGRPPS